MRTTRLTKLIGIVAIGVLALGACSSDDDEKVDKKPTPTTPAGDTTIGETAGAKITVRSFDIGFREKQLTAPAGTIEVEYVNEGSIAHDLMFESVANFELEVKKKGDVDSGTIDLEAGEYTFFCEIPGHRGAGMEGTLTVT